jgi:endothelin-converting enzyme/putative endopeptidase
MLEKRDPYNLFHKMDLTALGKLSPEFNWEEFFKTAGTPGLKVFNVSEPKFMQNFLKAGSLNDLKTYLHWQVAHGMAPYLSSEFVKENFAFYMKTLFGVKDLQPRWRKCTSLAEMQISEAVGREFVAKTFTAEQKKKTVAMTEQIQAAMKEEIQNLDWMSKETKTKALEKLKTMVNKVGYPDHWRDYSSLTIKRDDFAGNIVRGHEFEARRSLGKIGKPLDRGEWGMPVAMVNAYYDPQMNDINFPAGILQPPVFDTHIDDAPAYGAIGSVIGHEITHAFDDEGRQYDAKGNLKDWWTPTDTKGFESRAQCVVDQYAKYKVIDDIKINSKVTEGEDIADLGGIRIAYNAWKANTKDKENRDGLTPEQRFFIGFAQGGCEKVRPEFLRQQAHIDPHSPERYRTVGVLVNMPEFQKAFSCRLGQPMVRENRCRIW